MFLDPMNMFRKLKPFLSSSKGIPAPLNMPTPTPAPDRGGPVACLSGPVA